MQARLVKFRGDANYVMVIHRPIYILYIYIYTFTFLLGGVKFGLA